MPPAIAAAWQSESINKQPKRSRPSWACFLSWVKRLNAAGRRAPRYEDLSVAITLVRYSDAHNNEKILETPGSNILPFYAFVSAPRGQVLEFVGSATRP